MSNDNGIIRIGRKGLKKFAFGEEGQPFEVDVVTAFDDWVIMDQGFREGQEPDAEGGRSIPLDQLPNYRQAVVEFVSNLSSGDIPTDKPVTVAEAMDFIARLREEYDDLVGFFRPRTSKERASLDTSAAGLVFSEEESASVPTPQQG